VVEDLGVRNGLRQQQKDRKQQQAGHGCDSTPKCVFQVIDTGAPRAYGLGRREKDEALSFLPPDIS
jgi:hypothetical protein